MTEDNQGTWTRVERLCNALDDRYVSSELKERIRQWLLDLPEGDTREEAFARWVETNIEATSSSPDISTRKSFRKLARRLGFPVTDTGRKRRSRVFGPDGRPWRRVALRAAAVLVPIAVVVGGAVWLPDFFGDTPQASYRALSTGEGQSESITLPDGSTVRVDGGSRFAWFDDDLGGRNVMLFGEAFFTVASDPERPFTVRSGSLTVTVLGTEFGVSATPHSENMEVILHEGNVSVEYKDRRLDLSPGEMATVARHSGVVEVSEANEGDIMRLRGDNLSIDNLPALEALKLTAHYFDTELVLGPDIPTGDPITLMPPAKVTLEAVLSYIDRLSGTVESRLEDGRIVVSRK